MAKRKDKRTKQEEPKNEAEDNKINLTNRRLLSLVSRNTEEPENILLNPYQRLIRSRSPDVSMRALVKLQRLIQRLSAALETYDTVRLESLKVYAKKDNKGNYVMEPPPTPVELIDREIKSLQERRKKLIESGQDKQAPKEQWIYGFDKENQELWDKKFNELLECPADVEGEKITLHAGDIKDVSLSAVDIDFLAPVINFEYDE